MARQISRCAVVSKIFQATRMIEALEPRRLLAAFTVNGTSGPDVIEVNYHTALNSFFYDLTVNGVTQSQQASPLGGNSITINGLDGDDQIEIHRLHVADTATINPGTGGDRINVADGSFAGDIDGTISIAEAANEGSDTLFINDSAGSSADIHVNDTSIYADESGTQPDATVNYGDHIESFRITRGDVDGNVYVDDPVAKMTIELGDGVNNVYFDADDHRMQWFGFPMTIVGGTGANNSDWVHFDDSSAPLGRAFDFTPTSVLAKTMLNVDVVSLAASVAVGNTINITGSPAEDTTLLKGAGTINFGSQNAPVDLDDMNAEFATNVVGPKNFWDQDANNSNNAYSFTSVSNPFVFIGGQSVGQGVTKGSFAGLFYEGAGGHDLFLNGGTTADTFNLTQLRSGGTVQIFGGGGDDRLQMPSNKDLDSAIGDVSLLFSGGPGYDTLTLSDINDQTGDNDDYVIAPSTIAKGDFNTTPHTFVNYDQCERLSFDADADTNRIFFDFSSLTDVEIWGNGGNDTFFNRRTSAPARLDNTLASNVVLHGGTGSNILSLDDTSGPASAYTINASQVIYNAGSSRTITFDSFSVFELTGSNQANAATIAAKPAGATLNVTTNDGDDTIAIGGGDLDNTGLFTNTGVTVSGGAGNDRIVFDDHLANQSETYTFGNLTLSKNGSTFIYSTFELETLEPADVFSLQFNLFNTINVNSISSFLSNTTIIGGTQIPCNFNVGNGDLVNVSGSLDIQLGVAGGTINFNDQNHTANRSYVLTASGMTSPQPMSFSGATVVILNCGSGSDAVVVSGTAAGTALTAHGNNGNETFQIGGGNFANLAGNVSVTGDAGNDTVQYLDTSSTSHDSATLTAPALLTGARTHSLATVEHLGITMGSGGSDVALNSIVLQTTVTGGSGDDVVNIGNGSLNSNFTANAQFDGGAGTDTMNLLGQSDSANNTYAFPTSTQFRFGDTSTGKFVTFSGIEQGTLQCGSGDDTIDASIVTFALSIFAGAGNDGVTVTASTAPVTVDTGSEHSAPLGFPGSDGIQVGFVATAATVLVPQSDTVGSLSVAADCTLRIGPGAVLRRVLSSFIDFGLGLGGTIDLDGGALLWGATFNMPDFRTYLTQGYNGGAWNGTNASGAINSSLAASSSLSDGVGYGLGSQIAPTSIGSFSIGPNDMLLRYTLDGDANLDHSVNSVDFNILVANFGQSGRIWSQADFNYDGSANSVDFNVMTSNFGSSLPASTQRPSLFGDASILPGEDRLDALLDT